MSPCSEPPSALGPVVHRLEPLAGQMAEHRAHAAADLQQSFAGMELQVVGQEIAQQIGMLH